MRRFFNKLVTGVMVATMTFTALAPVTTMAAENDCSNFHWYATATYENGILKTRTCSKCGYVDNFVPTVDVDKCTHPEDDKDWYNGIHTDCTHDGRTDDVVCTLCGKVLEYGEPKAAIGHDWEKMSETSPTCTTDGKIEYYCQECGGTKTDILKATGHKWNEGTITLAPTATTEGKKEFKCTVCGDTKTETLAKLSTGNTTPGKDDKKPSTPDKDSNTVAIKETLAKVGTKYTVGGNQYTVTKVGEEVRFSKANAKKKSITIPATIKVAGISYKVTEVGANAFKNNKKVKKVVIGANVSKIAKKAFNKCPNLKIVVIKSTKLTKKTASKKCFNKVNKKMVIKVSKKSKKTYAKIFKDFKVR